MELKIEFKQVDDNTILLMDVTKGYGKTLPTKIYSMSLNIVSANIPTGSIDNLDVLTYMQSNRVDFELFKITNGTLGLQEGTAIPDGIYNFTLYINNSISATYSIVVITEILREINTISLQVPITAEITSTDIILNTNISNNLVAKWYYVIGMYYKLMLDIGVIDNSSVVNDDIDKLRRALLIVKNLVNG